MEAHHEVIGLLHPQNRVAAVTEAVEVAEVTVADHPVQEVREATAVAHPIQEAQEVRAPQVDLQEVAQEVVEAVVVADNLKPIISTDNYAHLSR